MYKRLLKAIKIIGVYSGFIYSIRKKPKYHFKPSFLSTHSKALEEIKKNSKVLDIGCNDGSFLKYLKKKKNCNVLGIDKFNTKKKNIIKYDLDLGFPNLNYNKFDYILILDVIEHLNNPEFFVTELYNKIKLNKKVKIIFSTPNIAFLPMRVSLFFGNFNYAPEGILDFTHKRLFTFSSFKNLLLNSNFKILDNFGVPAPFPAVLGKRFLSDFLLKLNYFLIKFSKKLFSFQMLFVAKL